MHLRVKVIDAKGVRDEPPLFTSPVVHLGREAQPAKSWIQVDGDEVAGHHGKIFWAHGEARYLNLTEAPTALFRGTTLQAELSIFFPQCTLRVGDRLGIGETVVEIVELEGPVTPTSAPERTGGIAPEFDVRFLSPERAEAPPVWRIAQLARQLRPYIDRHEILRQAADWLWETTNRPDYRPSEQRRLAGVQIWSFGSRGSQAGPRVVTHPRGYDLRVWWGPNLRQAASSGKPFLIMGRGDEGRQLAMCAGVLAPASDEAESDAAPAASELVTLDLRDGRFHDHDVLILRDLSEHLADLLAGLESRRMVRSFHLFRLGGEYAAQEFHQLDSTCFEVVRFLEKAKSGPLQPEALESALRAAREVYAVVGSLDLALSPSRPMERGRVCLDDEVGRRVMGLATAYRPCRIETEDPGSGVTAFCHPGMVLRATHHLVRNAALSAKRVRLVFRREVREHEGRGLPYVAIHVWDNGSGMKPEALATIFEARFSEGGGRGRDARARGFGAAIVAEVMSRHSGVIEIVSEPGMGTAVMLLLPDVEALPDGGAPSEEVLAPYVDYAEAHGFVHWWAAFNSVCRERVIDRRWFHG